MYPLGRFQLKRKDYKGMWNPLLKSGTQFRAQNSMSEYKTKINFQSEFYIFDTKGLHYTRCCCTCARAATMLRTTTDNRTLYLLQCYWWSHIATRRACTHALPTNPSANATAEARELFLGSFFSCSLHMCVQRMTFEPASVHFITWVTSRVR